PRDKWRVSNFQDGPTYSGLSTWSRNHVMRTTAILSLARARHWRRRPSCKLSTEIVSLGATVSGAAPTYGLQGADVRNSCVDRLPYTLPCTQLMPTSANAGLRMLSRWPQFSTVSSYIYLYIGRKPGTGLLAKFAAAWL